MSMAGWLYHDQFKVLLLQQQCPKKRSRSTRLWKFVQVNMRPQSTWKNGTFFTSRGNTDGLTWLTFAGIFRSLDTRDSHMRSEKLSLIAILICTRYLLYLCLVASIFDVVICTDMWCISRALATWIDILNSCQCIIMWLKHCHKPSPSHHHFCSWFISYHSQSWVVKMALFQRCNGGRIAGFWPRLAPNQIEVSTALRDIEEIVESCREATVCPYFKAQFYLWFYREYPHKIWPYMVQYLHFRILKFPLIW